MKKNKLQLEIVTVEKPLLKEEVDSVILPTPLGETGIMYNHIPLVTSIEPGELKIINDGNASTFLVFGGFAEVSQNKVSVIADAAEHMDEIDLEKAGEAKKHAEETMKQKGVTKADFEEAAASLRRSLIRIKVAKKKYRKLK